MLKLPAAVMLAIVLLVAPAAAQTPAVVNSSFTEPNGHRVLQLSTVVPAPPKAVWAAITTAEGWRRLGVQSVAVDFRVGGMIETNYRPGVPVGDRSNIKNQITAYVPERVLVIRNVQAPPGFKHAEEFSQTATVFELAPTAAGGTRLTASGVGFRSGPAFDELYKMFAAGNAFTLETLRKSFAGKAPARATGPKR